MYNPSIVFNTSFTFGAIASSLVPQFVVVLFVSWRRIVNPCAFPTKPFAGVNSTSTSFPFGVNLYVPCPFTVYVFSSDKVIISRVLLLIYTGGTVVSIRASTSSCVYIYLPFGVKWTVVRWVSTLFPIIAFPIVVCLSPLGGWVIFALKSSTSPENASPVGFSISSLLVAIRTLVPAWSNCPASFCVLLLKCNFTSPSCVISAISEASSASNCPLLLKSSHERTYALSAPPVCAWIFKV